MHRIHFRAIQIAFLAAGWAAAASASAGTLEVTVRDADGKPVADAVVFAVDGAGRAGSTPATEVEQVDKEYVPYVTAVQTGTRVSFPNHDPIRHHVYSFSDAKKFEIPLYKGTPAEPIVFDEPGVVALGCNIHDWMKAYVYVTDTPHFAVTDASGRARLEGLSVRDYRVSVWHPRQAKADVQKQVSMGSGSQAKEFVIEQKRVWRPRRAPSAGGANY
jgi:plastocyanin